jgi:hypothetical protein
MEFQKVGVKPSQLQSVTVEPEVFNRLSDEVRELLPNAGYRNGETGTVYLEVLGIRIVRGI